jgi:hypothetical protein
MTQPPPGYGYPPPGPPVPPVPPPPTSSKAITSLVLGVLSIFLCGLFTGIPAIFVGISARRSIRASEGRESGDGLAVGGIVAGIVGTVISVVAVALIAAAVVFSSQVADEFCYDTSTVAGDSETSTERCL